MSQKGILTGEELSIFCEQIALILRGGLPLHDGVEALCESYRETRFAPNFAKLNAAVSESGSLHAGLEAAGAFPKYMMEMTLIGEKTGELEGVMDGLAQYYSNEAKNRSAIASAIFYPLLLIVMMAVLIGVLVVQVLPIFDDVFASFAGNAASAAWMGVAMNAGKAVLIVAGVLIVLVLAVLAAVRLDRSQKTRQLLNRFFPPARELSQKLNASRFASTLGMMLRSGYPLDQSMELVKELFEDKAMREKMEACCTGLQHGASFPDAVEKLGVFQPLHCRMIRMGFKAGQTDRVMQKLAELYGEEVNIQVNRLVSIIEPTLVALMSVIIGAILLAVMLPLLSVMGSI